LIRGHQLAESHRSGGQRYFGRRPLRLNILNAAIVSPLATAALNQLRKLVERVRIIQQVGDAAQLILVASASAVDPLGSAATSAATTPSTTTATSALLLLLLLVDAPLSRLLSRLLAVLSPLSCASASSTTTPAAPATAAAAPLGENVRAIHRDNQDDRKQNREDLDRPC
jgi:hypothetical protein